MDEPPYERVVRVEAHAVRAWPATFSEQTYEGWTLRATPGLSRGRSNHALPPMREIAPGELDSVLERMVRFSQRHGTPVGIQVSPLHLHARLQAELDDRGWDTSWPTVVMTAPPGRPPPRFGDPGLRLALTTEAHATRDWLAVWERCEGRTDVAEHETSVFRLLRGRATFAQIEDEAVAIAVPGDGLLGLFCIAVAPERRRTGLGRLITAELMARYPEATPYLQVDARNTAALALYTQLGFLELYRYCHRIAPPDHA